MSEVQVRRTGGDNPGEGGVVWNYVVPRSWILLCSKASSEWRWVGEGRAARSFRSDRSSSVLFSFLPSFVLSFSFPLSFLFSFFLSSPNNGKMTLLFSEVGMIAQWQVWGREEWGCQYQEVTLA